MIQFNSINIIPELSEFQIVQLVKVFAHYEKIHGKNSKFFAFTNVLWYGLSDMESPEHPGELAFPGNFEVGTLFNIMHLADHLWKYYNVGLRHFQEPDQSIVLRNGRRQPNPAYRALMYFRDEPSICHALIGYVPTARTQKLKTLIEDNHWYIHHWDEIIAETNLVHTKMSLQDITHLTLLD